MGKHKAKAPAGQHKKKVKWPLAAALCLVIVAVFLWTGGQDTPSGALAVQTLSEGESLVIPVDELSDTVRFYPVEVNGTRMEILAAKDSQGTIRTAFNTCQICYSSGRGYYVQDGDALVCQNCGNRFTVDQVEVESGGCNPWPIFPENKSVTQEAVSIPYSCLNAATQLFANWKANF